MHADYVSTHTRILDGVRRARVRAIGEMDVPVGQHKVNCLYHDDVPAHAFYVHHDSDAPIPVCDEHLKKHMDEYRADANSYPPVVVPLKRRRA